MMKEDFSRRDFLRMGAMGSVSVATLGALAGVVPQVAFGAENVKAADGEEKDPEKATEAKAEGPVTDTIYIVDQIVCKPGDGKAMYDNYVENYIPGATERGMTLVSTSVNPPIWLTDDDSNNTLEFVWSVPGMMGWATMVGTSRYAPGIAEDLIQFWYDVDDRVVSRTRTLSAPDTDVDSLTTLARLNG